MARNAEMIFTGDELLRGDALNTNQVFLGEKLLDMGVFTTRALCVADDLDDIISAIRESLSRKPVVLVLSGGLGPTDDDLTREAVAGAVGVPLDFHEDLLERIREKFESRGYVMGPSNYKQATLPRGASVIPLSGTAPGFTIQHGPTLIAALPGVPWELQEMWTGAVEPLLRGSSAAADGQSYVVRRVRTFGIGESTAADDLAGLDWRGSLVDIGTRAKPDGLWVVLRALDTPEGLAALETTQARVVELLGDNVLGVDVDGLPQIVGGMLRELGLTLAVAESCTGGLLGARVTEVAGSSDYFLGGVVSYSNDVKREVLGVPAGMLARYGAVSREVAEAMAMGVRRLLHSDCALSITGVAGPGGGSEEKPVGLVYIGSVVDGTVEVEEFRLFGRREQVRARAALSALDLLRRRLLSGRG